MIAKVILETPFRADSDEELRRNIQFARRCMMDSLNRDEAPLVFHMLYPRRVGGPLDDNNPEERERGMAAARNWYDVAGAVVVYDDLGFTPGMKRGVELATQKNVAVKFRTLRESDHAPPIQPEMPLFPTNKDQ